MPLFPLDYTQRHIFKFQGILEHTQAYSAPPRLRLSLGVGAYQGI